MVSIRTPSVFSLPRLVPFIFLVSKCHTNHIHPNPYRCSSISCTIHSFVSWYQPLVVKNEVILAEPTAAAAKLGFVFLFEGDAGGLFRIFFTGE